MDKSIFLCNALNPPELPDPPIPVDTRCAMTGRPISDGYLVSNVVTDVTSQPHEIFKFPTTHCSVETARLFKAMRGEVSLLGNLFAGDATGGHKPMVSRDSAAKGGRPCWHDLIMALKPGEWTVAVFTEESKRRFWLDAPLCVTGSAWRPYLHYGNCSRVLTVNLDKLQQVLRLCETIYSYGFSKDAMLTTLFDNYGQVQKFGFSRTVPLEAQLSPYRDTDELLLACFVVQKNPSIIAEPSPQKETKTECQPTFLETPPLEPAQGQLSLW
jgi:hypothetical protein